MIRKLGDKSPAFVLETEHTSYLFRLLPTGQLEQLYYGPRISVPDERALLPLIEQHAFAPGNTVLYDQQHTAYSLEDVCLEMSAQGKGDIREPFLEIVHNDGSRTSDFRFRSARILRRKKPLMTLPSAYTAQGPQEHLEVTLYDAQYQLTLELHYDVYADCDCICRSSRLINSSQSSIQVERLLSMQLDLCDDAYVVSSFHGAWAREMGRVDTPLTGGKFVVGSTAGSSSSRANPFFMLHRPETSETDGLCYGFNLLYSGNHYAAVEVSAFGKTRVATGIHPQGFRYILRPGEDLEAPEAVLSCAEGFTALSSRMHRFVREHVVRGEWKDRPRPILLNSWEASYFDISESSLLSMARVAKDLGIELLVMDDGWFAERSDDSRSLGDWEPNTKKLPGGLKGICDKINAIGLDFGIWVEPEMVNVNSRLYAAHPEWVMEIPGNPHSEGRNQRLLDLANPAVVDYLAETFTELFSSANIRYVKWDFNRIFSDVYSPYLPRERQGETAHRYVLGLYRLMKTLTEQFPEILFEGCAAGGNRFDLGILSYFPQIWASDNTDAICRAKIQEGYSYGYPPSVIAAHVSGVPNHQTLRTIPLETRFNVAAFGLLGYEIDVRDLTGEEKKTITAQINLYKRWRRILQFGDFYRGGTGRLRSWTCVSPNKSYAIGLLLQELVEPNKPFARFVARGLDGERRYRFYNQAKRVNIKRFGALVNTVSPIHVRQDSLVHNAIARAITMPGEQEEFSVCGDTLMHAGVKLHQAFGATGYNDQVRFFQDFSSRLYFMEEEKEPNAKK